MSGDRRDGTERDWLALQMTAALRPREATALLRGGASPRGAIDALNEAWPSEKRLREAERALARLSGRLMPFGAPGFPGGLLGLDDAPPVLALRGDAAALDAPAVAIVGSRAASAYGLAVARRVAGELARAGVSVVSGLAFGVDAAAHRGALEAGGRTVAVQACGLDHVYPAAHRELADRIAASGAVVTEFAIGTAPRKGFFPLRNRLISGLSLAVVVVEARERSGSLVTARHAAEQGVDVFAVPGPIDRPHHVGTNRLLRDGAAPLLETRDLFDALAWPSTRRSASPEAPDSGATAEILELLRRDSCDGDAVARRLGRAPEDVASALLELELAGRISRDRDGRWRVVS